MLDEDFSKEISIDYERNLISLENDIIEVIREERDQFNEDLAAFLILVLSKSSRILSKVDESKIVSKIDKYYSNFQKYGDYLSESLPEAQHSFYKRGFDNLIGGDSSSLKKTQLKILNPRIEGSNFYSWISVHKEDMKRKLLGVITSSKLRGLELEESLKPIMGSANNITGGIIRTYSNYGEFLTMELTKELSSIVHLRFLEKNEKHFKYYTHISVMDDKTTEICWARNNLRWNLKKQPVGHNFYFASPPLHRRCRSVLAVI